MLFSRRLRTTVPIAPSLLVPTLPKGDDLKMHEMSYRQRYKDHYDNKHKAKPLTVLQPGTNVFVRDKRTHGVIQKKLGSPRSYEVKTPHGVYRRNRKFLLDCGHTPGKDPNWEDKGNSSEKGTSENKPKPYMPMPNQHGGTTLHVPYRTRSGRTVKPVDRLNL